MKVSILGKQRRGKKSFYLNSDDEYGYNIEAIATAGVITFNNVKEINWINEGKNVHIDPSPLSRDFINFSAFDIVNIRKAKSISEIKFDQKVNSPIREVYDDWNDALIGSLIRLGTKKKAEIDDLKLNEKEKSDIRRGLIIAMHQLDSTKNTADILLSNRLEIIEAKFR